MNEWVYLYIGGIFLCDFSMCGKNELFWLPKVHHYWSFWVILLWESQWRLKRADLCNHFVSPLFNCNQRFFKLTNWRLDKYVLLGVQLFHFYFCRFPQIESSNIEELNQDFWFMLDIISEIKWTSQLRKFRTPICENCSRIYFTGM